MTLFPFVRGTVRVSTTTTELYRHLTSVCEKDLPLIHMNVSSTNSTDYGLEWYEDSFMVWAVPHGALSRWIYTTIHCKMYQTSDGLTLSYHIRFNLWSNLLIAITLIGLLYLLLKALVNFESVDLKAIIIGLVTYPVIMLLFNDSATKNLKFIEELKKTFSDRSQAK